MADLSSKLECAEILRALANDTRLNVVQQLLAGPKHVGALNEELQVDKTLLSHHLKILRETGIIEAERDGKSVLCRLSPDIEAAKRGAGIDLGCCQLLFDRKYLSSQNED